MGMLDRVVLTLDQFVSDSQFKGNSQLSVSIVLLRCCLILLGTLIKYRSQLCTIIRIFKISIVLHYHKNHTRGCVLDRIRITFVGVLSLDKAFETQVLLQT